MKHMYDTADDYKEISAGQKHPCDDDEEHPVTPTKDAYYIGEDDREIPRTSGIFASSSWTISYIYMALLQMILTYFYFVLFLAPPTAIGSISSYVASSASYCSSTLPPLMPDLAEGFNLEGKYNSSFMQFNIVCISPAADDRSIRIPVLGHDQHAICLANRRSKRVIQF